jgi:hypothetical protein
VKGAVSVRGVQLSYLQRINSLESRKVGCVGFLDASDSALSLAGSPEWMRSGRGVSRTDATPETLERKSDTIREKRVVGIPPGSCYFWQPLRRSPTWIYSDKGRHHAMAQSLGRESTFYVEEHSALRRETGAVGYFKKGVHPVAH